MNQCEAFARCCAKTAGMTYDEAIEKYPRSYCEKSVYVNSCETTRRQHCIHCARAEALTAYGSEGKPEPKPFKIPEGV